LAPSLGTKRRCLECDAPFYDLNRDPITCPKCGAVHHPVARLKSDGREPPKGRSFTRRKPAEVAAEPAAAEAPEPPEEELDPVDDDDEDTDDEDADETAEDEAGLDADEPGDDRNR